MREDVPFTYRPIDTWPGDETRTRRPAPFASGWGTTLALLLRELKMLDAQQVVCQVAIAPRDFRIRDGHPKSNAKASHPGVILAFESKHGPLKYACDTFTQFDDNMRAIALGLEALRKVERYGITKRGEQYRGWSALPPGTVMGETMTREEAWRVLCDLAEEPDELGELQWADGNDFDRMYREAAKRHHPDQGGDRNCFEAAAKAHAVLKASV